MQIPSHLRISAFCAAHTQDSLGGNSKVLTFVNISPAVYNLGETVCSLNFATRCRSTVRTLHK